MNQSEASAEMFRSSWSLYECVHNALGALRTGGGYSLLDLAAAHQVLRFV